MRILKYFLMNFSLPALGIILTLTNCGTENSHLLGKVKHGRIFKPIPASGLKQQTPQQPLDGSSQDEDTTPTGEEKQQPPKPGTDQLVEPAEKLVSVNLEQVTGKYKRIKVICALVTAPLPTISQFVTILSSSSLMTVKRLESEIKIKDPSEATSHPGESIEISKDSMTFTQTRSSPNDCHLIAKFAIKSFEKNLLQLENNSQSFQDGANKPCSNSPLSPDSFESQMSYIVSLFQEPHQNKKLLVLSNSSDKNSCSKSAGGTVGGPSSESGGSDSKREDSFYIIAGN